jgi:Na+/phosphate symporter
MEYIKELSLSSVKMITIQIDIEHISDTYCSCSDKQSGEVADTTKGGYFYFFKVFKLFFVLKKIF